MTCSILIVEDNTDLLEIMSETLLAIGSADTVVLAKSLKEVQSKEDIVLNTKIAILDVNLGDENATGVDVSKWLRSKGYQGRIVFLTGHAKSDPQVIEATKVLDTVVLSKPASISELTEITKEACS